MSANARSFDVAVIGGGPGGYTAAEAAAREGLRVVLFEKGELGGTCLNRGCIPTKALLHAAETYRAAREASELGVCARDVTYDLAAMHARKDAVVASLRDGVERLMRAGKVEVVRAQASIAGPGTVRAAGATYEAQNIIIATGSVPAVPPIPGRDLPGVCVSDDLLEGEGAARDLSSLAIIGGGVIGVELAGVYAALGCQVTILEAQAHLLPTMDKDVAARLAASLKRQGVAVACGARVEAIEQVEGAGAGKKDAGAAETDVPAAGPAGDALLRVRYADKRGVARAVEAEGVLIATGRRASTEGLFAEGLLASAGADAGAGAAPDSLPELERGAVVTDDAGRTRVPGLWAIGDARAGSIQLAHVAEAQAKNVVAAIVGKPAPVDLSVVPSCVYASPEIACVGLTEAEAKAAGHEVACGRALAGASGKCQIEGVSTGFVKLVADAQTGVLLGAQLVWPRATDLAGELALAVARGVTARELASVVHPHPTFCESVRAAAEQLA